MTNNSLPFENLKSKKQNSSALDMPNFDGPIEVKGAREHNLKNISLNIPRNKITVITGLSGSGKSSLAFDTIYAEGQRRYVESLSSYARQFLEQLKKPDVDSITGLSPAISIEQKTTSTNPRSTVGTVTEIYDYLRLIYARLGKPYCYNCGKPISSQTIDQMVDLLLALPAGTKIHILAPVVRGKKGEYLAEFKKWAKQGYVRAKVDGEIIELADAEKLKKSLRHDIDLFIDRLIVKDNIRVRLSESLEQALRLAEGYARAEIVDSGEIINLSQKSACIDCGISYPEVEPRLFSFNNPRGACPTCNGIGYIGESEDWLAKKDEGGSDEEKRVKSRYDHDDDGVVDDESPGTICPDCNGQRLRKEALFIKLGNRNIIEVAELAADDLRKFMQNLKFSARESEIAGKIQKEVVARLEFLSRVGVAYLSMNRPARTLSGGEAQRIRLATQIGSSLVGVLYVLDEPSVGLHPRDHSRLLATLRELRDLGNTVLMVEHDEETIRTADHVIDLGPGAGTLGGALVAEGTPQDIEKNPKSLTGAFLRGDEQIPVPTNRRTGNGHLLKLTGCTGNNLKNTDLELPLGTFTVVTGVSGSGKSTLVIDTLYRAASAHFYEGNWKPAPFKKISGLENLDKVIDIDQSPIGRTPRSNPATYTGLFTLIRDLFSQLPDAKLRGYKPGRFSFNVKGGRCEACEGGGMIRIEMHFMNDVFVQCDVCQGHRYNRETLEIKYRGKSISDVLAMTVDEAVVFLERIPSIKTKLRTLQDVGLGYVTLGQSSTTLSGGEAQRIKLSKELSKRSTGRTLYILDEPTTGLHFEDIRKLLRILQQLADQGNTVVVIEHNLDVIKVADHVIDIGPEGGGSGGQILAQGTPEQVARVNGSHTGKFLKFVLA